MAMNTAVPRARGRLESLVREVCDLVSEGAITNEDGGGWTPHRLAKLVDERYPGSGAKASPGAVSDTLKRWREIGFAYVEDKPLRFVGYTEAAATEGLAALKAAARERKRNERIAKQVAEVMEADDDDEPALAAVPGEAESPEPYAGPASESEAQGFTGAQTFSV